MGERSNWLQESVDGTGATIFIVKQRNLHHLKIIGLTLAGSVAAAIICGMLMSSGGLAGMIIGGIFLLGIVLLVFVTLISAIPLILMGLGLRSQVTFAVGRERIELREPAKGGYPPFVDRRQIATLYVESPRGGGEQVSSSQLVIGTPAMVVANATAHTIGNATTDITRGLMDAIRQARYAVALNAAAKKILLANALTYAEAEYLMHRVEAAWAR